MMNNSIDLSAEHYKVLFYCKWNYGEVIQIHSPETFKKEYENSGLFDNNNEHIFESFNSLNIKLPFYEYFEKASIFENDQYIDVCFSLDNMMIMRIK